MSDSNNSDDHAALKRVAAGGRDGEKALEFLYRKHRRAMLAFVRSLGLDADNAEDVVHNVFLQVVKKAGTFRGESAVSSWLFGMARNGAMDVFRKGGKELGLDDESWQHIANTVAADIACPLEPAPQKALQDCVNQAYRAFAKSHPAAAELIHQSTVNDWDGKAIAEFLGRTAGAAREYLSQCKKKLKPFLEPCRHLLGAQP